MCCLSYCYHGTFPNKIWCATVLLSVNVAKFELFVCYIRLSKSTSIFGSNDVICRAIWRYLSFLLYQLSVFDDVIIAVEPRSSDTSLILTPVYNGHFHLSPQKAHLFSLKLTNLKQTMVNYRDNEHFSVSQVINSHVLSTLFTDTGRVSAPYFSHVQYCCGC